jgi:hypothetical protein
LTLDELHTTYHRRLLKGSSDILSDRDVLIRIPEDTPFSFFHCSFPDFLKFFFFEAHAQLKGKRLLRIES